MDRVFLHVIKRVPDENDRHALARCCKVFWSVYHNYHRKWHSRRAIMEASLANNAAIVALYASNGKLELPFVEHVVLNQNVLDVCTNVGANVGALELYFKLYTTPATHIVIPPDIPLGQLVSVCSFAALHDIHKVVGKCIPLLYRRGLVFEAVTIQNIAFWNGSWKSHKLLDVIVCESSKAQYHHSYTHASNKIHIRSHERLCALLKRARKRNMVQYYSGVEWCLTAIVCGSYEHYVERYTQLLHHTEKHPQTHLRKYYYFEFSLCDNVDIVAHWYAQIPYEMQRRQFARHMKKDKAAKLSQKKLLEKQLDIAKNYDHKLRLLLRVLTVAIVITIVLIVMEFYKH